MRAECREKVSKILGRTISEKEGQLIVKNLARIMKKLDQDDPNFKTKTQYEQAIEASKELAMIVQKKAEKRANNNLRQVIQQNKLLKEMERLSKEEGTPAFKSVAKILVQVDYFSKGVLNQYVSELGDMFNSIDSRYFGLIENEEHVAAFVRAAFGEQTTARAQKGFKAFTDISTKILRRAEAAGLDTGYLENYLVQSHDNWKLINAGEDTWVDQMMNYVDRSRYMRDDGSLMNDAELRAILSRAYKNIVINGNPESSFDMIAQQRSKSKRPAPWENESRVLHFKDSESWLKYHKDYGRGSLSGMLVNHIRTLAHDVAMLEKLGPNPEASFEFMKDIATAEANNAVPNTGYWGGFAYSNRVGLWRVEIDDVFKNLTGEANLIGNSKNAIRNAHFMQGFRNLEVAGKLGKAFISSFSDIPTLIITSRFNRLGWYDTLAFFPKAFGSEWKDYASRMGLIADSITSDFNRWSGDNLGYGWTAKVANGTLRASFLIGWTDAIRRGFSLNMMASFGKLSKKAWNQLDAYDQARLIDGGITEADWNAIVSAGIERYRGVEFLNMNALKSADVQVASKVLAFIVKESEMASLNPDLVTRTAANRGSAKGTLGGEFARSFFLFKSFPTAMMEKQWERSQWMSRHGTHGGIPEQVAYLANMAIWTTVLGGISVQVQNMLNGKDFRDVESMQFWFDAFMKGGGAGFIGDFVANLLSEDPRMGAFSAMQMMGPVISTGIEAVDLATRAAGVALWDKESNVGNSALRLARSHTPFINMWYTSAALDRAIFNQLNELMSPGYIQRMQTRTNNMYGQEFWWNPTNVSDTRMPRMSEVPE